MLLLTASCSSAKPTTQTDTPGEASRPVRPPSSWVDSRVEESTQRLKASEAGALMLAAIDAHGGLSRWYNNGPIGMRFRYEPVNKKMIRDTYQVIDTWSSRARHNKPGEPDKTFGWDGSKAWATYKDEAIAPRFWALTPYYFVGVPFVFADAGINLSVAGETTFEERTYDLVKVTFAANTGDAPDDFYIVYIDRETRRVGGVRYIVSYPGFFPDGGHSPEKFMAYDGAQTISGITLPETFRTFKWDPEARQHGELVTNSMLTEVSFLPDTPTSFFTIPKGADIIEGY